MISRKQKRKQAYQFICRKLQASGLTLSHISSEKENHSIIISLAEIYSLKNGSADPSEQLIAAIKTILYNVATEEEIVENLVLPFSSIQLQAE